ncbi:PSD1 and planctomycete cytochrome C domain-containing protein [Stieleria sp. JC731]|uniref:PSD1 and planctomycete cytochrome C domain-containing protein n=1 Tax=Pirellulaceae TaxID=2691357 RepID=UPI001E3F5D9F|nr:PSD1 and planctomycete cytochrome C domain-containing protein [Stieleria sp. JC731]MCC9598932.1 PSD1 and planctomycete cytochrome C domain-containing protein [Stieleria sp. JC731]
MRFSSHFSWTLGLLLLSLDVANAHAQEMAATADSAVTPEQLTFFETKIRPVLVRECYGCHSDQSGQNKGGLKLDTQSASLLGGDSGAAIVPGDLESSLLYTAITHQDFVMPPKRKLSDAEIADFRTWILDGAPDPRVSEAVQMPSSAIDDEVIARAKATFWSYQTPTIRSPQDTTSWATTEIDRYIEAGLTSANLQPAADADPATLLRRLCFDLVGLPPSPEQVRWFESAYEVDADAAVERVVDRLLDSKAFGEHWGRHWLDVARYAESTGREVNMTFPHAWRYRDYVIESFNNDKPYDEFVQEQIAGDLLPAEDDQQWADHLIATSFLAIGTKNLNEQSAAQFAADLADEQIDATTRVFLGTSVACARCHDHKFDPIRQSDYYAMAGIFRSTKTYFGNPPSDYGNFIGVQQRQRSSLLLLPVQDEVAVGRAYSEDEFESLKNEIQEKRQQLVDLRNGESVAGRPGASAQQMRLRINNELAELSAKISVLDDDGKPRSYCMGVQDQGTVGNAPLLVRGEIDQPADRVPRDIPAVLREDQLRIPSGSSGRLELARWIGSDQNTLAARVMVNRIWHHVFGQGIVPTTEDFGATGMSPSHPELLDHLAIEFVKSDWSIKAMVRQMMTSRAYRMKSSFDVTSHQQDPDNRLLWRANVKRLGAESIRDAMLLTAGELQQEAPVGSIVADAGYTRVRGESLQDPRDARQRFQATLTSRRDEAAELMRQLRGGSPRERLVARNRLRELGGGRDRGSMQQPADDKSLDQADSNIRSVYLPVVRDFVPRSLEVFDFADPSLISGTRETSNTPNQALFMMNNPTTLRLSQSFAERLTKEASSRKDQVSLAFLLAYGRSPSDDEKRVSFEYFRGTDLDDDQALAAFCQALFAAAEFRYLN